MAASGEKRAYRRDTERYPLFTEDEEQKLRHLENLYRALISWGGTNEEWARAVGKDQRTINRWLKDPSAMDAESFSETALLLRVSEDYLLNGSHHLRPSCADADSSNAPTIAETDLYAASDVGLAYCELNEENQRIVTSLIMRLLKAEESERELAWFRQLARERFQGDSDDSDGWLLLSGAQLFFDEHKGDLELLTTPEHRQFVIRELNDTVESLRRQRKEQLRKPRTDPDHKEIAAQLMSNARY